MSWLASLPQRQFCLNGLALEVPSARLRQRFPHALEVTKLQHDPASSPEDGGGSSTTIKLKQETKELKVIEGRTRPTTVSEHRSESQDTAA
eukprot:symbB.v1.2.038592.t1/scaffold6070.1/size21196/1